MIINPARLDDSQTRLRQILERSKRTTGVPFTARFICSRPDEDTAPPLTRLVQGGRGGEVRLRLYLLFNLIATRTPHKISPMQLPQAWAKTLALDPQRGPRRVNDAINWLDERKYVKLQKSPRAVNELQLLSQFGNGDPYTRPSTATDRSYIRLPLSFYSNGWILELSPVATAILLALMDLQGKGDQGPSMLSRERRIRYGLSPDSWTKGTDQLAQYSLLHVSRESMGSDFEYVRPRNAYQLDLAVLDRPAPAFS